MNRVINRGDIFWAAPEPVFGAEQNKPRPWLVISNNVGNFFGPTVIVAGISRQEAKLPTHAVIGEESGCLPGRVMCEQIKTMDKHRLMERWGRATPEVMAEVDKALAVAVGLHKQE